MYRKPMNIYLYLPFDSDHHPSVFRSLIRGELHRINRRCQTEAAQRNHREFFRERLRERGYPHSFFDNICKSFDSDTGTNFVTGEKPEVFFLKLRYDRSINRGWLRRHLVRHQHVLSRTLSRPAAIRTAWGSNPNFFRRNYNATWRARPPAREGGRTGFLKKQAASLFS